MKGYMKGFAECYNGNYSCYDQGYFAGMNLAGMNYDGMTGTFDGDNYDESGSSYYNGYVFGCILAPGNYMGCIEMF